MSSSTPRRLAVCLVPAIAVSGLMLTASPALATSTSVVVNEVYGGGGNSGATYTHDFVELANMSTSDVDLSGWKVQYFSASGGAGASLVLAAGSHIAAHGRFLIQQAKGTGGTTPLPSPDAVGTATMSATDGRIDLTSGMGTLVDRVGYGTSSTFEGSGAAPRLSNTTSGARTSFCTDTDDNAADFTAGAPTPESSATPSTDCPAPPPVDEPETIAQIQGTGHLSPLAGASVNGVAGVVTAVGPSGFWMQSTVPDDDVATSEGLYVFTSRRPGVLAGDSVTVDGRVAEFRPGGSGGNDNTTTTEITGSATTVVSSGNPVPAPLVIGVDRVAPQQTIETGNPLNVEYASAPFRPATDAIDFYESLEGMYVGVRDAQVVGPTASFGEIPVVPGQNVSATRSPAGGVVYGGYDQPNAMRLQLDDALIGRTAMPDASVGDTLPGLTTGVVDYSFSNYKLLVTAAPTVAPAGLQRESAAAQTNNQLAVATFNVENLAPGDAQEKFDRLAQQVVRNLRSPDVLALEEIQDNSGAADDGVVDSTATSDKLTAAIAAAGGPAYAARWVNPHDGTDGGQPGGNIRQVFLFRLDRDLTFVDTPGGDATTAVGVTGTGTATHLTASPGRINPTSSAWASSRKPLVGEFTFRGKTVFVIANHFNSKGGDDPLFGRWQQPVRGSEVQRHQQAQQVRSFVDTLLAADPQANVVVLGDLNDFEFSRTADILVGDGSLVDLPRTLPAPERFSYVFEGNSQVLDHILISSALTVAPMGAKYAAYDYDIVHTNAQFHDQDSDHDPQVVRLALRGGAGL